MNKIKPPVTTNNCGFRRYKESSTEKSSIEKSSYSKKTNGLVPPNIYKINSIFVNKQSSKKSSIPVPSDNTKTNYRRDRHIEKSSHNIKTNNSASLNNPATYSSSVSKKLTIPVPFSKTKTNNPVSFIKTKLKYTSNNTELQPSDTKKNNENNKNLKEKYKKRPGGFNQKTTENKKNISSLIYKKTIHKKKNNSSDASTQCDTYEKTTSTSTSDNFKNVSTQTDSAITQTNIVTTQMANKTIKISVRRKIINCGNTKYNKNLIKSLSDISSINQLDLSKSPFDSQSKTSYKVILENGDANHCEILDFSDFQLKNSYKVISENGDENHSDTFNFSDSQSKNFYTVHNNSTNTENEIYNSLKIYNVPNNSANSISNEKKYPDSLINFSQNFLYY